MAWTTPDTFSVSEVVTASKLNTNIRDNLRYLKGLDGAVSLGDTLKLPPTSGTNGKGLRISDGSTDIANFQGLDTGTTSYIFFSTNRYYDGSGWQQLNSRAGGDIQLSQDEFSYYTFAAASSTPTERMRVTRDGRLGLGVSAPTGPVHVKGAIGNWLCWEYDGVDATSRTVLPASSLSYAILGWVACRPSNGATATLTTLNSNTLASYNIYSVGGDTCQMAYASGGYTVARTAGSLTYKVVIFMVTL